MERRERLTVLQASLQAEAENYRQLLASCRDHGDALLKGQAGEIELSLQHQLRAMADCRTATAVRLDQTRALAVELGLGDPCSTGRLIASLPGGESEQLYESYEEMKRLSACLVEQNARNKRLSEHRLDLMQGDFESLQRMVRQASSRSQDDGDPVEGSLLATQA